MNFQKNKISKHSWDEDHTFNLDEKNVPDRESTSTPRKIKETIHSLKKPNHFKKNFLHASIYFMPVDSE